MGLNYRLNRLERRLPDPEVQSRAVFWIMFDGDVPDWATEALRPYLPTGDVIVMWHQAPSTGQLSAEVNGRWYKVTPDGCEPVEGTRVSDTGVNQWQ